MTLNVKTCFIILKLRNKRISSPKYLRAGARRWCSYCWDVWSPQSLLTHWVLNLVAGSSWFPLYPPGYIAPRKISGSRQRLCWDQEILKVYLVCTLRTERSQLFTSTQSPLPPFPDAHRESPRRSLPVTYSVKFWATQLLDIPAESGPCCRGGPGTGGVQQRNKNPRGKKNSFTWKKKNSETFYKLKERARILLDSGFKCGLGKTLHWLMGTLS